MLLRQDLLFFLMLAGLFFFLFALEADFLLAQGLHQRINITPDMRSLFQDHAGLLIDFFCSFCQFYLGHSMLAPPPYRQ